MYFVIRIFFKDTVEAHSVEQKNTLREALVRSYSIAATDINNVDITYSYTAIMDENGNILGEPIIFTTVYDEEGQPVAPFNYIVIRIRIKNNALNNSIEYKTYDEAYKRYFNIIAAGLQDNEVSYHVTALINSAGDVIESRAFSKENEE